MISAAQIAASGPENANAIIAARKQIVRGAVGMVHLALNELDANNIVSLDEERKAAMVSNLLVVLCSDERADRNRQMIPT